MKSNIIEVIGLVMCVLLTSCAIDDSETPEGDLNTVEQLESEGGRSYNGFAYINGVAYPGSADFWCQSASQAGSTQSLQLWCKVYQRRYTSDPWTQIFDGWTSTWGNNLSIFKQGYQGCCWTSMYHIWVSGTYLYAYPDGTWVWRYTNNYANFP